MATPLPIRALAIAARKHRILSQDAARRCVEAATAAGCGDVDALRHWLTAGTLDAKLVQHLLGLLPPPGTNGIGPWMPLARLAEGGMGTVWLAGRRSCSGGADHLAVLKTARAGRVGDGALLLKRLEREVSFMRRLDHPHIVRCLDAGTTGEGAFSLVLEYVDGGDLEELVAQRGVLPPHQALDLARQITEGVAEAHRLGLVHRDLKPANVFLTTNGRAKVADFGLARSLGADAGMAALTMAGSAVGSPAYMAPEQVRGESADRRCDLYALGAILFFALTGRPPFLGRPQEVMHQHVSSPPPDPRAANAAVPSMLAALVVRCLAKDRDARPADGAALLAELAACAAACTPGPDVELPTGARDLGGDDPTPACGQAIPGVSGGDEAIVFRQHGESRMVPAASLREDTSRLRLATERTQRDSARMPTVVQRRRLMLAGSTAAMPLADLLGTLRDMRANGVLHLHAPHAWRDIVLRDGMPVHAVVGEADHARALIERLCQRTGDPPARWLARFDPGSDPYPVLDDLVRQVGSAQDELDAALGDDLLMCCGWNDAAFEFVDAREDEDAAAALAVGSARAARCDPIRIAMEAARLTDELDRLTAQLPPPSAVPGPVPGHPPPTELSGSHPGRLILSLIDGTRSLGELAANAFLPAYTVIALVSDGLAEGWLRQRSADDLLSEAELVLAGGSAEGAVRLLGHVLAQRPGDPRASSLLASALARAVPHERAHATPRTLHDRIVLRETRVHAASEHIPGTSAVALEALRPDCLAGDARQGLAAAWLALVERPDGSGRALHLWAQSSLVLGKLAREPVHLTLRDYPVQDHIQRLQRLSRSHGEVRIEADGRALFCDLGAGNGSSLDGVAIAANASAVITPGAARRLDLAGVVSLWLRAYLRSGPVVRLIGNDPLGALPACGLDAISLTRPENRPELAYALVPRVVRIGDAAAQLPLVGAFPGAGAEFALLAGHWIMRQNRDGRPSSDWQPVAQGSTFTIAGVTLHALAGQHTLLA